MAAIEVTVVGSGEFEVEVSEPGGATTHRVTVPAGYPGELGAADAAPDDLVRESFRFLLEREPKEQILTTFELPVIERYFPDYRQQIAARLTGG